MNAIVARWAKSNPKLIQALRYIKRFHRVPNLRHPKNIYEVVVNLSMDPDNQRLYARLADKHDVRGYVAERIGPEYLVPLLGHYPEAAQVDWDALPQQFAIKTTNGCATNIIVKDKSQIDRAVLTQRLHRWMSTPFGIKSGEPHYLLIKPSIIAEAYIDDKETSLKGLTDYKFYCVHGKPAYMLLCANRTFDGHTHKYDTMIYDMDWRPHPEFLKPKRNAIHIEQPQAFGLVKELAAKLAQGLDFVRVDFYIANGKPLFGEMTFTPGFDMENLKFMEHLGKLYRETGALGKKLLIR